MIDLDHNATTAPSAAVSAAMARALAELPGNPSSIHRAGMAARHAIELARASVSSLVGCTPRELVFTSGGTESCSLAIRGSLDAWRAAGAAGEAAGRTGHPVIVTTRLEHSAVRECAVELERRGQCSVEWLPHRDGAGDLSALPAVLDRLGSRVALVSLMWANNETGAILDAAAAARVCRERGVRFHTDATQWVGKMPTDFRSLGADLLTFSAHKLHGPKGIGALVVRRGTDLAAQVIGGPHETGRRGGTENVPGIIGFGVAADEAREWLSGEGMAQGAALRDAFEAAIARECPSCVPLRPAARLWNTSSIGFPRLAAEALLLLLSERGVCASAGAACSSGSLEPSPVIVAMGVPAEAAHGTLRFSIGRHTTREQLEAAAQTVGECVRRLAGAA